jgi:XTP/dITP diphosphohydrolase
MKSKTLILATRNIHKLEELKAMLGEEWEVQSVADYPELPEIEETGTTFLENATLKAVGISRHVEELVLADDSGLEVEALGGEPGVHSAHYAGFPRSDAKNNRKVLDLLKNKNLFKPEERRARFVCVLALARAGELVESFTGTCEGHLGLHQSGQKGFGYDPIFIPDGHRESFGQLSTQIKNRLSHRAVAFAKFRDWVKLTHGQ